MRIGLVTGTVGVGKSTIGFAVAERASEAGIMAAFLDLDELSRLWSAPENNPFREELILANLRAVAPNYEAAGASLLVLAWAIEGAEDLVAIEKALNSPVKTVRLVSSPTVVEERLRNRHQGPASNGLAWHLQRAPVLAAIQGHLLVPTVDATKAVEGVADEVLQSLTAAAPGGELRCNPIS
jgi:adenylylsulfate kinase